MVLVASIPSVDEIVKGQIYLGNLSAAMSRKRLSRIGVTHIVSVCPEYPSTGGHHLAIDVQDSEYEDLLIHLPRACEFIQAALDQGGKVLVHCVMGISRSTTVVAAYLMKAKSMDAVEAVRFVKAQRPQAHPNYGFITQLAAFAACRYEPCATNPTYRSWKRKQRQKMQMYLSHMADTTEIIPGELLLSSGFPEDAEQAEALIHDMGVSHMLSLSPSKIPSGIIPNLKTTTKTTLTRYLHLNISNQQKEDLLVTLPEACQFVCDAVNSGGLVLVHCLVESRACTVVCAALMLMKRMRPEEAFGILEDVLPLFNPTRNFLRHLELFAACGLNPTRDHPLVRGWVQAEEEQPYLDMRLNAPLSRSSSLSSSAASSPAPSTPASSRTSSTSSVGGARPVVCGVDGVGGRAKSQDKVRKETSGNALVARASHLLSETNFDLSAFGRALVDIQESRARECESDGDGEGVNGR